MTQLLDVRPGAVAHVVEKMAPGGIETLVLDLARRDPSDIAIISLRRRADELIESWPALAPYRDRLIGMDRGDGANWKLSLALSKTLSALKPRAVVAHHVGPLIHSALATRLSGPRRLVHVEHDAWHYTAHPKHAKLLKLAEFLAKPRHLAVSTPIHDVMRGLLPKAEIAVAPPGIDTSRYQIGDKRAARERLDAPLDAPLIGTAGRLAAVKAQHVLIDAMAQLPANAHCVIAGEGEERDALEKKIAALGLGGRVKLLGHRDDIFEIMPAFDIFCLPSLNEGLPRVVLEAQACDTPVVASDVGALKDAVCPETGRLTPAGDADALARALSDQLAATPPSGVTRAFIVENFDFQRTWDRFAAAVGPRADATAP